MCGRYALYGPVSRLREAFDAVPEGFEFEPRWNAAPLQCLPVVRQRSNGERVIHRLRWGLVPSWSKDATIATRLINARGESVADLQERDLSDVAYPYIWLDATYIKCRDAGRVQSTALVTAIGAGSGGYRRLLGLDAIDTESYDGWRAFLLSLRARGVDGVVTVAACVADPADRAAIGHRHRHPASAGRAQVAERRGPHHLAQGRQEGRRILLRARLRPDPLRERGQPRELCGQPRRQRGERGFAGRRFPLRSTDRIDRVDGEAVKIGRAHV